MCIEKTDWEKVIEFHGHACPGLAMGYRVSKIALREFEEERAKDEELVAVVENNACGVDAIQLLTGCSFGKGNLIFKDYGKHVYTFISRKNAKAVRISVRSGIGRIDDDRLKGLLLRMSKDEASPEDKKVLDELKEKRTIYILEAKEEEFCDISHPKDILIPQKARIYNTVICAFCGEGVAEARVRIKNQQIACIPCFEANE